MANKYWVAGGNGNYNSTTNWSATSGGASGVTIPGTADDVFFDVNSGAGTAIINTTSNSRALNLTGFTGTLDFVAFLYVRGNMNFGTGGYTVTGLGYLSLYTLMTITSNGTTYTGNVYFSGNVVYTLADDMSCSGNVTFSQPSTQTINGNTLFCGADLASTSNGFTQGTTNIVLNGTGTWSNINTNGGIKNNFTINTAGTITLGVFVNYSTGTLTYVAGTVITTGSNLTCLLATTFDTNGIIWNDISTKGAMTLTSNFTLTGFLYLKQGTNSFVLSGGNLISTNASLSISQNTANLTLTADQTFKSLHAPGYGNINNNTLTITEDISITNGYVSGSSLIVYAGTGTWSTLNSNSTINNHFTINTLGTLTISGAVYTSGFFIYIAGTIIDTGATVGVTTGNLDVSGVTWNKLLVNGATTLTSDINAVTFGTYGSDAVSFILAGNNLNFTHLELGNSSTTTLPFAWVCQDIEFSSSSAPFLNNYSITINGNILQSGNGYYRGTTYFDYTGTGTWTATGSNASFTNSFTINTAGTLTFISANLGGGIFTYTAGTVITTGSTLNIKGNGTTMNHGNIVWNDVTTITNVTSLILNNQLVCSNALTIDNSQLNFYGTDGTFDVYYLNLNSSGTTARNPRLVALKTYLVRAGLTSQGTLAFPITLSSNTSSSQAIFTVSQGATIDVGFLNAQDIDSSLGKRIYSYKGVFSNTLNWQLLPTDVTPEVNTFAN